MKLNYTIRTVFTILLLSYSMIMTDSNAYAQDTDPDAGGTISGRLKQEDGMPAIGARIFVYTFDSYGDEHIVGSANTADDNENEGKFRTEKMPPGNYTVSIKYPAYKKVIITNVPVIKDSSITINLKLEMQSFESSDDDTITYISLLPKPPATPKPAVDTTKKEEKNENKRKKKR